MTITGAAAGVDVGGTATKAAIVDRSGAVSGRVEVPTDPAAGTKGIVAVIESLLERAAEDGVAVDRVGIGAAGFVDAARGSVTFSPNLVYDDPHIAEAVAHRFGLPVVVDNDANVAVWGERAFGAARGCDHVALITLGTGVGSGFVVEGRIVRGAGGAAAELGHIVVDPAGPACPCGLRGCLEQFASGTAIARAAQAAVQADAGSAIASLAGGGPITARHVALAALDYDDTARQILAAAGRMLGVGMSNVVNVFDPEVIVLAGSVVNAGEPYLGPARDQLHSMTSAQRRRPVRLVMTELGDDAGIIGAAAVAFDEAAA